jgi:ribosomal protein L37AE/L43A
MSGEKVTPPNCQSCRVRVASHRVPASKGVYRWKCETCFKRLAPSGFKEKVPVQVSPLEFVTAVLEKEHLVGKPIMWAQWPNEEKK